MVFSNDSMPRERTVLTEAVEWQKDDPLAHGEWQKDDEF
jgi:hypothetical protein